MTAITARRALKLLLMCLFCIVIGPGVAAANNTWFLPGDAFFFTRLTKIQIAQLQKEKDCRFDYGNHWDGGIGCGYAGHPTIAFPKMPAEMKTRLLSTYSILESQLELNVFSEKETKLLNVFIYNSNYDWKKHRIAIQYNENWVAETVKFGYQRDHIRMESFIPTATQRAWRDAPVVPRLHATFPKQRKKGQRIVPVLKGDYQLIVIPKRNFTDYFKLDKDGLPLIVITKDSMTTFVSKDRKWVEKKPPKK